MSNPDEKKTLSEHPPNTPSKQPKVSGPSRSLVIFLQTLIWHLSRHWLILANLISGFILFLGFLAPVLMSITLPEAGQMVYGWLAPHNHQLPQRSYFLFGQSAGLHTYSLAQILASGANPDNLEAFVGNPAMGYKMALNQRMTAIFVGLFVGGVIWGVAGGRPKLGPVGFILCLLPLLVDGFSHMVSENSGQGFRDGNLWAVSLTGGLLPTNFYQGTTIGTLNWWLRTLTGLLFGFGFVWFLFTYFARRFTAIRRQLEPKLVRVGAIRPPKEPTQSDSIQ